MTLKLIVVNVHLSTSVHVDWTTMCRILLMCCTHPCFIPVRVPFTRILYSCARRACIDRITFGVKTPQKRVTPTMALRGPGLGTYSMLSIHTIPIITKGIRVCFHQYGPQGRQSSKKKVKWIAHVPLLFKEEGTVCRVHVQWIWDPPRSPPLFFPSFDWQNWQVAGSQ